MLILTWNIPREAHDHEGSALTLGLGLAHPPPWRWIKGPLEEGVEEAPFDI